MLGGLYVSAQNFGSVSTSASWGNNGYVNDYYYGEQTAFQLDDNVFNYGSSATQDIGSTSSDLFGESAYIRTAASSIVAGSTLMGYEMSQVSLRGGRGGGGIAPPVVAPIGDGWDVLLFLLLLAVGYGVCAYRKSVRQKV